MSWKKEPQTTVEQWEESQELLPKKTGMLLRKEETATESSHSQEGKSEADIQRSTEGRIIRSSFRTLCSHSRGPCWPSPTIFFTHPTFFFFFLSHQLPSTLPGDLQATLAGDSGRQSSLSSNTNLPVYFPPLQLTTCYGLSFFSVSIPRPQLRSWWYTQLSSLQGTLSAPSPHPNCSSFLNVSSWYLETHSTQDSQWPHLAGSQEHFLLGNTKLPYSPKNQIGHEINKDNTSYQHLELQSP